MIFDNAMKTSNTTTPNNITTYNESEVLTLAGNAGGSYMHDALYESYIQAKIDAEDRLAFALKEAMVITESDYSNIRAIQEAKLGDKIKSKWHKFVAFIKNLFAKFLESMSNLLLDEKEYLEKYKDIILRKEGKDIDYSYTGNYTEAVKRIMNTHVPIFSYSTYKAELEAEGEGQLANKLVNGFNYVDGDPLAEQYKSYFLDLDHGQTEGKLSQLNMATLYNFCYDFPNIKKVLDKNLSNIDASTRAIETEINKQLPAAASESAIFTENGEGIKPTSGGTTTATGNTADNKEKKDTNLTLTPSKAMQNVNRDEDYKAKEKENTDQDINTAKANNTNQDAMTKATNKWIEVTRAIISAQLTACQQVAKDYMEIIRTHVRSWGGTDKKSKEGNIAPKKGQTYEKSDALKKAEQENKEAGERLRNSTPKTNNDPNDPKNYTSM